MKILQTFVVPPEVCKLLHVWKDRQKQPVITVIPTLIS